MTDPDVLVQAIADGASPAQTAERFGVSVDEVRDAQKRALAAFSDGEALRLDWMLESKLLAACGLRFYQIATRDNDPQAAIIFLKASERRATLMGAYAPAATSVKLIHQVEPVKHETSTERLNRALDRIAGITARERELTDLHEFNGDNSPSLTNSAPRESRPAPPSDRPSPTEEDFSKPLHEALLHKSVHFASACE